MVRNLHVEKGGVAYNREIFHIEEKVLDDSYFQLPEGYTPTKKPGNPLLDFLTTFGKTQNGTAAGGKEASPP